MGFAGWAGCAGPSASTESSGSATQQPGSGGGPPEAKREAEREQREIEGILPIKQLEDTFKNKYSEKRGIFEVKIVREETKLSMEIGE